MYLQLGGARFVHVPSVWVGQMHVLPCYWACSCCSFATLSQTAWCCQGITPLIAAAACGHHDAVKALVKAGSDICRTTVSVRVMGKLYAKPQACVRAMRVLGRPHMHLGVCGMVQVLVTRLLICIWGKTAWCTVCSNRQM